MYKNILVTGGCGFIGSNLVHKIKDYFPGSKLTVFDELSPPSIMENGNKTHFGNIKNIERVNDIDIISGNLKSNQDLKSLLENQYDLIFHQAAISDTTATDEKLVFETNVLSFKPFLDYISEKKCTLIFASSASVYGNLASPQVVGTENPLNYYAKSKLEMEQIAKEYFNNSAGSNIIGLRYFNVYGPREEYKETTASMILQLINSLKNNNKLLLFEKSKDYYRDFVYINDVVDANFLASISNKSGIFNVGSGISRSFLDVALIIKQIFNSSDTEISYIPNLIKHYQTDTLADIKSTHAQLNYVPSFSLEEGINHYISHLK